MYLLIEPPSLRPIFHLSSLYGHPFSSYRHLFVKSALNDPQTNFHTRRSKVSPIYGLLLPPEFQISLSFALKPAVFELHPILKQLHRMAQNVLNH